MKLNYRNFALVIVSACLLITGCSKKEDAQKVSSSVAKIKSGSHLEYIPADTPYAFVGLEPMPKDLIERLREPQKEILGVYVDIMEQAYNQYVERAADAGNEVDDLTENKWIKAISAEFKDGFDEDTFTNFGFDKWFTPTAIYGHGVLPVVRMGLQDPDKFRGLVSRIEERASEKIPTMSVEGQSVWAMGGDDVKVLLGVVGKDLVITMIPSDAGDSMAVQLLGLTKPASSLADTSIIPDLMKDKGYTGHFLGFIDSRMIMKRIIEAPTGVDAELFSLMEMEQDWRENITPVCKTELMSMADNVPRILFGTREVNNDRMTYEYLVEVAEEFATEMAGMASPVPRLGEKAGFMSFGFSFDLANMRTFAGKRILNLKNNPYECEFLEADPDELDEAYMAINNPATGMVQGLHGFNFIIDELDVDTLSKLVSTTDFDNADEGELIKVLSDSFSAKLLVSADNAAGLFGMVRMMSPDLANLDISIDGGPVRINDAIPTEMPFDIYAAMSERVFAFSFGKDADTVDKKYLILEEQEYPPLLSYSIDGHKYMKLLSAMFENPKIAEEMSEEEPDMNVEDMQRIFKAMYGVFGYISMDMRMRNDGVAFEQTMEFP